MTHNLALTSTIGTKAIPACPACGGFTTRKDAIARSCESCGKVANLTFYDDGKRWAIVPVNVALHDYKDGNGETRTLRVMALA